MTSTVRTEPNALEGTETSQLRVRSLNGVTNRFETSHLPDAGDVKANDDRDKVVSAFERVALMHSCRLDRLLEETRSRGIPDEVVQDVISMDESQLSHEGRFRCLRNGNGDLFVFRDAGSTCRLASIHELFNGLPTEKPVLRRLPLSADVAAKRGTLTPCEDAVIDAGTTLSKSFARGGAVRRSILRRVSARFTGFSHAEIKGAIDALVKRKVFTQKHFEVSLTGRSREETRYDVLTDDEDCRLLLMACRHTIGPTFDNRNVALRLAVLNLMNARFGTSRNQFRKAVRKLGDADVIEHVLSHSVQAFRLTEAAGKLLKG